MGDAPHSQLRILRASILVIGYIVCISGDSDVFKWESPRPNMVDIEFLAPPDASADANRLGGRLGGGGRLVGGGGR